MMGFRSGRLLRPFFTGSPRLFPTLPLPEFPFLPLSPEFLSVYFSMCSFESFQFSTKQCGLVRPLDFCILLSYVQSWRTSNISWCFFSIGILVLIGSGLVPFWLH